ncbi:MAG: prohibitin family protein [Candidatus Methanoperedens sp.]|nr:prohibitin family protein [Candidatus Methanoperedens sp.]
MKYNSNIGMIQSAGRAVILIFIIAIIVGGVAWAASVIIPAGHVGVVDYFGQVQDDELGPGFYLINPLKHVEKINTQTQEQEFKEIRGTLTREGLEVVLDASIIWHIEPDKASDIYKTVRGSYSETLIIPNFMGLLREEIKKYTAEDIYTGKSTEVEIAVESTLKQTLAPRGIIVERVLFRGLTLPPDVTNAIQSKIREKQAVEQMRFTVEKQRLEAERVIIEANATAQSNFIKSKSITPELISWEFVQALKENKNFIYVTGSGGVSTILPMPQGVKQG